MQIIADLLKLLSFPLSLHIYIWYLCKYICIIYIYVYIYMLLTHDLNLQVLDQDQHSSFLSFFWGQVRVQRGAGQSLWQRWWQCRLYFLVFSFRVPSDLQASWLGSFMFELEVRTLKFSLFLECSFFFFFLNNRLTTRFLHSASRPNRKQETQTQNEHTTNRNSLSSYVWALRGLKV
jgi:hypothetical protein